MKLLLTSSGFDNPNISKRFIELCNTPIEKIKIFFIPLASRTDEELRYVEESKEELYDLGIKKENLIISDFKKDDQKFEDVNVIYVCGGNTYYLLDELKKSGFDKKLIDLTKKDVVYVGVSAGSILAGPDIEIVGFGVEGDENDVGLKDLSSLNLVNFTIFPHYKDKLKNEVEDFRKRVNYNVIALRDGEAVLVVDDKKEVIR